MDIKQRLHRLRQRLYEEKLDIILITQTENYRYLSGFTGSAGTLLISQDSAILATDSRYIEQAGLQAPDFEIVQIKNEGKERLFVELASRTGAKNLGFEAKDLCQAHYCRLNEAAEKMHIRLIPTEGMVDSLRAIKDKDELACMIKAAKLADAAIEYITQEIHPGMKEKDVAWEIEKFLRENGSEPVPFELIVASGPNAAHPHARPTERAISENDPIVIDIGGSVGGYSSDLTRTLCLNSHDKTFNKIYDIVLRAQLAAINKLETGISAGQVDSIARKVIGQEGYGESFGHGLGHGVGLANHEQPRIGPNSNDVLVENMVFTIEPGIYIIGWGGVRIEDTVMLEKGRARMLTKVIK